MNPVRLFIISCRQRRVSWHYFWRRNFFVNVEKVQAFADMGEAANIRAEGEWSVGPSPSNSRLIFGPGCGGMRTDSSHRCDVVGISMAGAGHLFGRAQLMFHERPWK